MTIIIEQTRDYPNRMQYHPYTKGFSETAYPRLFHKRGVSFPYGWLKESGTPPGRYLDIILITHKQLKLGG